MVPDTPPLPQQPPPLKPPPTPQPPQPKPPPQQPPPLLQQLPQKQFPLLVPPLLRLVLLIINFVVEVQVFFSISSISFIRLYRSISARML